MSTSLPALVRDRLLGAPVHRAVPAYARGFSSLSTRYAVISDGPGVYVYDSGGLLGQPSVVGRDGEELDGRLELAWVAGSSVLLVQVWLDAERVVGLKLEGATASRVARALAPAAQGVDSRLPVSVRLGFSLDRQALITALTEEARGDEAQLSVIRALSSGEQRPPDALLGGVMGRLRTLPDDRRALLEHLFCGEVHARVRVEEEVLTLSAGLPGGVATIPLSQLQLASGDDREVTLVGTAIAAGFQVERLVLCCPDRPLALALRARFDAPAPLVQAPPDEARDALVILHGAGVAAEPLEGVPALLEVDAEGLELHRPSGELLHRFSLGPGGTAVQGTAESLVLLDGLAGPLGVEVGSEAMQRQLATHPGVAAAARAAARSGPYVGRLQDGTPVALEVHDGVVHWAGRTRAPLPVQALEGLDLQAAEDGSPRLVLSAGDEEVVLVADHAMLEGMASHLRAAHLALGGPERIPSLVKAVGSLEKDWLVHGVAGPLVRVHHSLSQGSTGPLLLPEVPEAQVALLAAVVDAMGALRRQLELRWLGLPGALAREDQVLLEPAGLDLAPVELSPALGQLPLVLAQLDRLDRTLQPARVLRPQLLPPSLPQPALGEPAPVLAHLGPEAARQAAERLGPAGLPRVRQALEAWLPEYNHLLLGLLPLVLQGVEAALPALRQGLFQALLEAQLHEEAQGALLLALAQRFARLENGLRFPGPGGSVSRREELGWVRRVSASSS